MKQLYDLAEEIKRCTSCKLWKKRLLAVPGQGQGDIMLIGDFPGEEEDRQGTPFVGEKLDKLLSLANLSMEEVFVTYCLKCYPISGFGAEELGKCRKWLDAQIEVINPKLIILFGETAMNQFVSGDMVELHGQMVDGKYFVTSWETGVEDFKKLKGNF